MKNFVQQLSGVFVKELVAWRKNLKPYM